MSEQQLFRVHIYAVVVVPVDDVPAENPEAAITKALKIVDLAECLKPYQYAECNLEYLVDAQGPGTSRPDEDDFSDSQDFVDGCALAGVQIAVGNQCRIYLDPEYKRPPASDETIIPLANGRIIRSGWIDKHDPDALPHGDYLAVDAGDQQVFWLDSADLLADPIEGRRLLSQFLLACIGLERAADPATSPAAPAV